MGQEGKCGIISSGGLSQHATTSRTVQLSIMSECPILIKIRMRGMYSVTSTYTDKLLQTGSRGRSWGLLKNAATWGTKKLNPLINSSEVLHYAAAEALLKHNSNGGTGGRSLWAPSCFNQKVPDLLVYISSAAWSRCIPQSHSDSSSPQCTSSSCDWTGSPGRNRGTTEMMTVSSTILSSRQRGDQSGVPPRPRDLLNSCCLVTAAAKIIMSCFL